MKTIIPSLLNLMFALTVFGRVPFTQTQETKARWAFSSIVRDFTISSSDKTSGKTKLSSFRLTLEIPFITQEMDWVRTHLNQGNDPFYLYGNELFPVDDANAIEAITSAFDSAPETWHGQSLLIVGLCNAVKMNFGRFRDILAALCSEEPNNDDYMACLIWANLYSVSDLENTERMLAERWRRLGNTNALVMALKLSLINGQTGEASKLAGELLESGISPTQDCVSAILLCVLQEPNDERCQLLVDALLKKGWLEYTNPTSNQLLLESTKQKLSKMEANLTNTLKHLDSACAKPDKGENDGKWTPSICSVVNPSGSCTNADRQMFTTNDVRHFNIGCGSAVFANDGKTNRVFEIRSIIDLNPGKTRYSVLEKQWAQTVFRPVPFQDHAFCKAIVNGYERNPSEWKPTSLRMVGQAYRALGDVTKAKSVYELIVRNGIHDLNCLVELAELYLLGNSPEDYMAAQKLYLDAYEHSGEDWLLRPLLVLSLVLEQNDIAGQIAQSMSDSLFRKKLSGQTVHDICSLYLFCLQTPNWELGEKLFNSLNGIPENHGENNVVELWKTINTMYLHPLEQACRIRFTANPEDEERKPMKIRVEYVREDELN